MGLLGGAAPAMATVTTTNITAPADGTLLFQNKVTNPSQTFTVTGTTDGTTGDSVDIRCYQGNSPEGGYTAGIPVQADGSFSQTIPESAFGNNTCQLLAVRHATSPNPPTGLTGPRVGFSSFSTTSVQSGTNAGLPNDFLLWDNTTTAQSASASIDYCGWFTELHQASDPSAAAGGNLFNCGASFYNSNADYSAFGGTSDLSRSEIQVDSQNAYGTVSAASLFTGSTSLSGFPADTATLNSFDTATGDSKVTDIQPLVKCTPSDGYNPTSTSCTAFASTGVSLSRVYQQSNGARVSTQADTYSSTDGAQHTIDLLYETDANSSTAGWELPGESAFTHRSTGDTAGAASSGPGTIYAVNDPSSSPAASNPIGNLTFADPYNAIRFDDALYGGESSILIDYQRTIPAGGCTTIAWSYGTGESASEVQGFASSAASALAAPTVAFTSPTRVTAPTATVSGTATAPSGLSCVSVNGVAATVSGNSWTASVPLSAGQNTVTVSASAASGGTATSTETVTLDQSAPTISVATPANGATYTQGQSVSASYACSDPDGASDVASCAGPVASGAAIDTSTVGSHSFKVSAADLVGNSVTQTVTYTVSAKSSPPPPPPPPSSPKVNTSGSSSDRSQGSGVLVTPGISVSCPAGGASCTANETATTTAPVSAAHAKKKRTRKFVIGKASFRIQAGSIKKLTFKLNATGRRLLRKLGHLRVTVKVVSRVDHHTPVITTKTITIRQPHKKKKRHH